MKINLHILLISTVYVTGIWCQCDLCQSSNFVACHEENVYSLCVNGSATNDFITCPKNHVCTSGNYVCYPAAEAKSICERKTNLCGVCSENKVYACINETTIAFCYGSDKPMEGAEVSYCLGNTVCDIYSEKGFCSEGHLVKPSCNTIESKEDDNATTVSTTTDEPVTSDTTTKADSTIITTTFEPIITTLMTQPTSTTAAAITTAKTNIPTTTVQVSSETTTIEPSFPITDPSIATTAAIITSSATTTEKTTTTLTTEATNTATKPITTKKELTTTTTTTEKTTAPTTTSLTTSTLETTPSSPPQPAEICQKSGTTGSFSAEDPTCKTFVICYKMNGSITGLKRNCPPNQYFAPDAQMCSSNKPENCV